MTRRSIPLLFALALLLALAPAASARVPRDFVGMTSEDVFAGDAGYRASNLSAQRSAGVGMLRQTFDWSAIETSPGRYDFSTYDAYVLATAAHGIRVMPILFRPPAFHTSNNVRPMCPPRRLSTMGAFARALVQRYGRNGSLWRENPGARKLPITAIQIWNEPSLGVFWCNRPRARAYVRMLKVVGRAIKRTDRRTEVVTAGIPPSKLRSAVPIMRYLNQLYNARAKRHFDTLAINSYARNHRELARLLRSVRRLMKKRRDRRAKIWITELGWGDTGPRHRFIVGARGQASRISKSYSFIRRNRRKLRLRGVVYFSWRDAPPFAPNFDDQWGLHTGLLRLDGSRKPAFRAFSRATRRLR